MSTEPQEAAVSADNPVTPDVRSVVRDHAKAPAEILSPARTVKVSDLHAYYGDQHAVKGVSLGDAFEVAGLPGSQAHDEILWSQERGYYRETNRAGGLEGGMTTGLPLVVRGAMKPLPTLTQPLRSVDIATKEPTQALRERTDSCTVPAAGVVGEAMVAFVLADAYRRKFGGDHIDDVVASVRAYEERIGFIR